MALIITVSSREVYDIAKQYGRGDNFTPSQWAAIGEHLEEVYEGENHELDIVGICCDFSACDSVDDFYNQYSSCMGFSDEEWADMGDDEKLEAVQDYLNDNTSTVQCEEDSIIWVCF